MWPRLSRRTRRPSVDCDVLVKCPLLSSTPDPSACCPAASAAFSVGAAVPPAGSLGEAFIAAATTESEPPPSSGSGGGSAAVPAAAPTSASLWQGGVAVPLSSELARGSSPRRRSSLLPSALGRLPSAARRESTPLVSDGVALPVLDSCGAKTPLLCNWTLCLLLERVHVGPEDLSDLPIVSAPASSSPTGRHEHGTLLRPQSSCSTPSNYAQGVDDRKE